MKKPIPYVPQTAAGLSSITAQNLLEIHNINMDIISRHSDLLWLAAKHLHEFKYQGWNSFMEELFTGEKYVTSRIIPLPFIDGNPCNYDTIYTVLHDANLKCINHGQRHIFVTFDQPLYAKAREIMARSPQLDNVIVRIGGFHMLMSYMGCIGKIMEGSGLKEALATVYAFNSIDKLLEGHIYARAVRAHVMVNTVLADLLFFEMENSGLLNKDDLQTLRDILDVAPQSRRTEMLNNQTFSSICNKFNFFWTQLLCEAPLQSFGSNFFD